MKRLTGSAKKYVMYFLVPILILATWYLVTHFNLISPIFLPKLSEVANTFTLGVQDHSIFVDLLSTLYRVIIGFLAACAIGVPIGILMGYSKRVYNFLEFTIELFRSIPATALFPLFLLIFGIGDSAKIAITIWAAGFIIIINTMYGVHLGKDLRRKVARIMRIKGWKLFTKIILPEALPQIFTGFRVALSYSLVIVVLTEMFLGTGEGLGRRIMDAQLVYQVADMYMTIIVTGVLGFALNKILLLAEKKLVHWKGK